MKQMIIKILGKGDTLVDYRPDRIILRTKKGEYLIYEIAEDAAVVCILSSGWRKGLFFDFTPA